MDTNVELLRSGLEALKEKSIRVRLKFGKQKFTDEFFEIEKIEDCHTANKDWTVVVLKGNNKSTRSLVDIMNISGIISEKEFVLSNREVSKLLLDLDSRVIRMEKVLR